MSSVIKQKSPTVKSMLISYGARCVLETKMAAAFINGTNVVTKYQVGVCL